MKKYPKLLKSARGQLCTLQVAGVCNHNAETTVAAHLDSEFKGVALKSPDYMAVFACSECHTWLDQHQGTEEERLFYSLRALQRTLKHWFDNGIIK